MTENETNSSNDFKLHPIKDTLELAAYPASVAAGYLVARTEARRSVYKNIIRHDKELQKIQERRAANYQKELFAPTAAANTEFHAPAVVEAIENKYRLEVKQHFQKLGFKHWPDYWQGMTHSQKINALALGSTVAGITIGATLMITQNKALSSLLDKHDKNKDAPSPG